MWSLNHFMRVNKRTVLISALAASTLLAGGCSTKPEETKTYSNDGYLGVTNTNPSLPLSPTYHNYQSDTDMMKGALGLVSGISDSSIRLNGSHAKVKLYVPRATSSAERDRIQQEAMMELSKAVPRYQFNVRVVR